MRYFVISASVRLVKGRLSRFNPSGSSTSCTGLMEMSFSMRARLKSRAMTARIFRTVSQSRPASRASSSTWRTSSSVTFATGVWPMVG
ncbi:MAG TPA: hypothetical protein VGG39_08695 [Polyangiaceae bacterium]